VKLLLGNNCTEQAVQQIGREAKMATMIAVRKNNKSASRVPKALRQQVERLLEENFAYMDSPQFRRKSIEHELFEEALP
jgi:hypothetical protein